MYFIKCYFVSFNQETKMMPCIEQISLVLVAVSVLLGASESKKDEVLYCSACKAIADEMNYSISQTDPKMMINVGGFRLKPDGTMMDKKMAASHGTSLCQPAPQEQRGLKVSVGAQGIRLNATEGKGHLSDLKVPLVRSETYLTELLEEVCKRMSDYAPYEDPDTKEKSYKRFAPRTNDDGNFPDFKNFKFGGPEGSNDLTFACDSIVEELEDDIISLFTADADNVAKTLCSEVSGHCKSSVFHTEF
ncbi:hypothetical protein DNTS_027996 [Danionella cerebrum]|uniref:DUF3456 domain-containing protein n=1 Tax=Danionella cerebrum TaxID=2873325 RepID=A0A553RBY5_9TELE|nr:hypothetical protein DNTS_027996 [Danionella translucida]